MHEAWPFLVSHKESITFLIALVSFALSTGQLGYTLWNKRTNLSLEIQNLEIGHRSNKTNHVFLLTINNCSSSPIAITRMILVGGKGDYPCYLTHQWCGEHYYPNFSETDIPCTERVLTVDFPIQLTGNQSFIGFVSFPVYNDKLLPGKEKSVTFKVITNKRLKTIIAKCPDKNTNSLFV